MLVLSVHAYVPPCGTKAPMPAGLVVIVIVLRIDPDVFISTSFCPVDGDAACAVYHRFVPSENMSSGFHPPPVTASYSVSDPPVVSLPIFPVPRSVSQKLPSVLTWSAPTFAPELSVELNTDAVPVGVTLMIRSGLVSDT